MIKDIEMMIKYGLVSSFSNFLTIFYKSLELWEKETMNCFT